MRYSDLSPVSSDRHDHGASERRERYLIALGTGMNVKESAQAAGVLPESVPYWRVRHPEFARREVEIREAAEVTRTAGRLRRCVCGNSFEATHKGQEFCSKSCATRELKSGHWCEVDTAIMAALKLAPATRRELVLVLGVGLPWVRSVLNRLRRRGLVQRIGAARGLYAKWEIVR